MHNDHIVSLPGKVEKGTPKKLTVCFHFILLLMNILVVITVVTIAAVLLIKVLNLEMNDRKYNEKISILGENYTNLQSNYDALLNQISNSNQSIISLHDELPSINSQIDDVNTSYHNLYVSYNNISNMIMDLYKYTTSPFVDNYLSNCSDIFRKNSSYASGNYIVRSSTGVLRSVYCDTDRTFGGKSTGWMRVAELDVNNCPPGLKHEITNSVNTCVVIEYNAGCTEIVYHVYNVTYTKITGQIRGYQVGTSDGFVLVNTSISRPIDTDLNNNNLDGVSISTNGQHVWSFAAGYQRYVGKFCLLLSSDGGLGS